MLIMSPVRNYRLMSANAPAQVSVAEDTIAYEYRRQLERRGTGGQARRAISTRWLPGRRLSAQTRVHIRVKRKLIEMLDVLQRVER